MGISRDYCGLGSSGVGLRAQSSALTAAVCVFLLIELIWAGYSDLTPIRERFSNVIIQHLQLIQPLTDLTPATNLIYGPRSHDARIRDLSGVAQGCIRLTMGGSYHLPQACLQVFCKVLERLSNESLETRALDSMTKPYP